MFEALPVALSADISVRALNMRRRSGRFPNILSTGRVHARRAFGPAGSAGFGRVLDRFSPSLRDLFHRRRRNNTKPRGGERGEFVRNGCIRCKRLGKYNSAEINLRKLTGTGTRYVYLILTRCDKSFYHNNCGLSVRVMVLFRAEVNLGNWDDQSAKIEGIFFFNLLSGI